MAPPTGAKVDPELVIEIAARDGIDELAAVGAVSLHVGDGRVQRGALGDRNGVRRLREHRRHLAHHDDNDLHSSAASGCACNGTVVAR